MSTSTIGGRVVLAASNAARKLGSALDSLGATLEVAKYTERLVPSTRFVAVDGIAPALSETTCFVAPSANVIGNVSIGKKSSVWYGATVRGDVNKITIGDNTSIGDRAVVHVAKIQGDLPTSIGNNVTVGPGAIIHAATIQDDVIVGASAQILDGSTVESFTIISPGSIVSPGTAVTGGKLWSGSPAKMIRALTAEEINAILETAEDTYELATLHAEENAKDYKQLAEDEDEYEDRMARSPDYFQKDREEEDDVLGQGSPGRIFNSALTHPEEALKMKQKKEAEMKGK